MHESLFPISGPVAVSVQDQFNPDNTKSAILRRRLQHGLDNIERIHPSIYSMVHDVAYSVQNPNIYIKAAVQTYAIMLEQAKQSNVYVIATRSHVEKYQEEAMESLRQSPEPMDKNAALEHFLQGSLCQRHRAWLLNDFQAVSPDFMNDVRDTVDKLPDDTQKDLYLRGVVDILYPVYIQINSEERMIRRMKNTSQPASSNHST